MTKFQLFECISEIDNFSIFNRHFQSFYYQFIKPFHYLAIFYFAVASLLKPIIMVLYKNFQKIHFINVVLIFSESIYSSKLFKLMNIIKCSIILKMKRKRQFYKISVKFQFILFNANQSMIHNICQILHLTNGLKNHYI